MNELEMDDTFDQIKMNFIRISLENAMKVSLKLIWYISSPVFKFLQTNYQ